MTISLLYAITLLILGFILILLEIFVIPGFNIFGVIGFLTVCAGVVHAYINLGLWPAAGVAGLGIVGTVVLIRLMVRARAWHRLVLSSSTSRASGYDSVEPGRETLLGCPGEALTALRPAGRVRIGERVVDVVSQGGFINPGELIEVIQVAGNRVVVQKLAENTADPPNA